MKYLLDTNACIRFINGRVPQLRERLLAADEEDIAVAIITKAEMFYGSAKSQTPQRSREKQVAFLARVRVLPFDDAAVDQYAILRVSLERRGVPISHPDMQIAAIALANQLVLITHNTREFSRIDGLTLQDWEI